MPVRCRKLCTWRWRQYWKKPWGRSALNLVALKCGWTCLEGDIECTVCVCCILNSCKDWMSLLWRRCLKWKQWRSSHQSLRKHLWAQILINLKSDQRYIFPKLFLNNSTEYVNVMRCVAHTHVCLYVFLRSLNLSPSHLRMRPRTDPDLLLGRAPVEVGIWIDSGTNKRRVWFVTIGGMLYILLWYRIKILVHYQYRTVIKCDVLDMNGV